MNQDLWKELLRVIAKVEARGAAVSFWHVRRQDNTEADRLANEGLLKLQFS